MMRLLFYSLSLPTSGFVLMAADALDPKDSLWLQAGAFGVVCLLLVLMCVKVVPYLFNQNVKAEEKRQIAHQEAEDRHLDAFQKTLDIIVERNTAENRELREVLTRLAENIQHLTVNCAKVHAVKRDED